MNKNDNDDPNLYISEMTQNLIDEFSKYCPKNSKKNKNNHPWVNLKIKRMMNNQNIIYKKSVRHHPLKTEIISPHVETMLLRL